MGGPNRTGDESPAPPDRSPAPSVADAAAASSAETAAAIDRAAAVNDDPQVGEALADAAASADKTVSRVGWLRGFLHRIFPRSA
jgi:hypothetical protein